jgi:hypothetical protein
MTRSVSRPLPTRLPALAAQHTLESIKNILHLANNRRNQQEERPAAEENRRRDDQARPLPRDAQPDYYRTSKNLTGNGLTWVPRL